MFILKAIFQNTGRAFRFSLFLYLLCLFLNTSFRVMGFDLSSEIHSILNGDFFYLILLVNLKIFLIYYLFYGVLQITIDFWFDAIFPESKLTPKSKKRRYTTYTIFLLFTLALFFHSVIHYPQMYGEFFYIRHTYLQRLLYFLTDHVNPKFFEFFFLGYIASFLSFLLAGFLYKANVRYLLLLSFLVLILFFHINSFIYGIIPIFLAYQIIRQMDSKVNRFTLLPVLFSLFGIVGFFYF